MGYINRYKSKIYLIPRYAYECSLITLNYIANFEVILDFQILISLNNQHNGSKPLY